MRTLLYLSFFIICLSCTQNSTTEKHISSMDNIVDVKHNVKEISTGEIMINRYPRIYLMDNYLIIQDYKAYDNLIYIFDKNTFKFLASTGQKGEGPSEIANMGDIGIDEVRRKFYVTDHGKQKIFSFDLDSVLADPTYIPYVKIMASSRLAINSCVFFTICILSVISSWVPIICNFPKCSKDNRIMLS